MSSFGFILTCLLVSICIWLICFFCSVRITNKTKFIGEKKLYLRLSIASLMYLLFFLSYGLLDKKLELPSVVLASLWYLLFPASILFTILFFILFLTTKKEIKYPNNNSI